MESPRHQLKCNRRLVQSGLVLQRVLLSAVATMERFALMQVSRQYKISCRRLFDSSRSTPTQLVLAVESVLSTRWFLTTNAGLRSRPASATDFSAAPMPLPRGQLQTKVPSKPKPELDQGDSECSIPPSPRESARRISKRVEDINASNVSPVLMVDGVLMGWRGRRRGRSEDHRDFFSPQCWRPFSSTAAWNPKPRLTRLAVDNG